MIGRWRAVPPAHAPLGTAFPLARGGTCDPNCRRWTALWFRIFKFLVFPWQFREWMRQCVGPRRDSLFNKTSLPINQIVIWTTNMGNCEDILKSNAKSCRQPRELGYADRNLSMTSFSSNGNSFYLSATFHSLVHNMFTRTCPSIMGWDVDHMPAPAFFKVVGP